MVTTNYCKFYYFKILREITSRIITKKDPTTNSVTFCNRKFIKISKCYWYINFITLCFFLFHKPHLYVFILLISGS